MPIKTFVLACILALPLNVYGSDGPVQINGQHPHPIKGQVTGYDFVLYQFSAAAGQTLTIDFKTNNLSSYFNLYGPNQYPDQGAFFIGSTQGNQANEVLTDSGLYTLQVYLMRNAARRNEVAQFSFDINLNPATP